MSEYKTLRDEMLQRLNWLHYLLIGTVVFIGTLVYRTYEVYPKNNSDSFSLFLLIIILIIITILALSAHVFIKILYSIGNQGSYLAIYHELDGKRKWHLRNRLKGKSLFTSLNELAWGEECRNAAIVYISTLVLSLGLLFPIAFEKFKVESLNKQVFIIAVIVGVIELVYLGVLIYKLWRTNVWMKRNIGEWYAYYKKYLNGEEKNKEEKDFVCILEEIYNKKNHPMNKEERIKELAFYFFQKRGCKHGHDLDDWFKAERKIRGIFWRLKNCFKNHPWKYDLFISIIGGVVASTIVTFFAWLFINWINPNKVVLCLRYAYEYNYEQATQDDPIRKILENVPVKMKSGQNLWFAVVNENINSLENCTLHLDFQDGLNINEDKTWQVHLPNKKYTYLFYSALNNRLAFGTNPLQIEFQKEGKYRVSYSITAKNMKSKDGYFFIESR